MWFKSVEKDQFAIFAQQKAHLNAAYWMTTKALLCHENTDENNDLAWIIRNLDMQSRIKIESVKTRLERQEGLTKDLTTLELNYVHWYCNATLSKIDSLKSFRGIVNNIPSDSEILIKESQFIRDYSDKMPGDDLESEWDRGIYLIYQCISIAEKGNLKSRQWADIKKRITAVAKIMRPDFKEIKDYCEAYAGHLGLELKAELAVSNQLFVDISKQFSVGSKLVSLSKCLLKLMEITDSWQNSSEQAETFAQKICTKLEYCHFHMIEANLAKSENIAEVIDEALERTRIAEAKALHKINRAAGSKILRSYIDV